MSIHQRIKERRIALGLKSHKALADLVDVSWQTVQLWEKEGGTAPNRNRIEKVAQVLGVTAGWLQNGDQGDTPTKVGPVVNPETLADALKLTTETSRELRLLTVYRLADKKGRLLIDQAVDSAGEDIDLRGALNESE